MWKIKKVCVIYLCLCVCELIKAETSIDEGNIVDNDVQEHSSDDNVKGNEPDLLHNTLTDMREQIDSFKNIVYARLLRLEETMIDIQNNMAIKEGTSITTSGSLGKINWDQCTSEIVTDSITFSDYVKPLLSLEDKNLRRTSLCTVDGRIKHLHMRFGLKADNNAQLILSPDSNGTNFHFRIRFFYSNTQYGTVKNNKHDFYNIFPIINLNGTEPSALYLTIADGTLELRHEESGEPFLEHHDDRLKDVWYFGFDSFGNTEGHATVYYDC